MYRVVPVPCLKDNYAYLVICEATQRAAIVDPSESQPVLDAVAREGVTLAAVWATHHHPDHVGGIAGLGELEVVGYRGDEARIPKVSRLVDEGVLKTTLGDHFGVINAANLRRAHELIERGAARGKIVLEGF